MSYSIEYEAMNRIGSNIKVHSINSVSHKQKLSHSECDGKNVWVWCHSARSVFPGSLCDKFFLYKIDIDSITCANRAIWECISLVENCCSHVNNWNWSETLPGNIISKYMYNGQSACIDLLIFFVISRKWQVIWFTALTKSQCWTILTH